jgi:hypothetical protein
MSRVMSAVRQRERIKSKDLTTGPSVRKNSYRTMKLPSVDFEIDTGLSPTDMLISLDANELPKSD